MCELDFDLGKATFNTYGTLTVNSNTNINDNIWHNVIGTYDNSTSSMKIYIDGVLKGSITGTFNTSNSNLYIGERNLETGLQKMDGILDDIGIWNRALSTQEISNMFNQVTPYSDTCNAVSGSLTQGLVGYWPFCGNANDDSGKGNNGTVSGATLTTDRFGNTNSAYSFNGTSNYIQCNLASTLNTNTINGITLSGWTNSIQYTYSGNQTILGLLDSSNAGYWIGYGNQNSTTGFLSGNCGNAGVGASMILVPSTPPTANNWYHVVMTCDFNTNISKLYINGVYQSQSTSSLLTLNFNKFIIGKWWPTINWFQNGKIDDVGIWNRALTTQEVTQLYNQNQCFTNTTVTDTLVINVGQLSYTNPIAYANNITIYPNPASTQVNIAFNNISNLNGGSIKIINSLGQQVATTPIKTTGTTTTMTLSTWGGSGLYFVQIVNPQGQIVDIKKILLQ